jgi:hypothetical protein
MKMNPYKKTLIILSFALTILFFIVFLHYISLFRPINGPNEIKPDPTSLNIYEHIQYNEGNQKIELNLSYDLINSFFQNLPLDVITSNEQVNINTLFIDSETKRLIGKLSTDNRTDIHFSASFDLILTNDMFIFNISEIHLGKSPQYMSQYIFKQYFSFDQIIIPLVSTSDDLFDDFFSALFENTSIDLIKTEDAFVYKFDATEITYSHQLYPIYDDYGPLEYPIRRSSNQKYLELSQLQLMKPTLEASSLLEELNQIGYYAEILTNTSNDVILRIEDSDRNFTIDLNLVFAIDVLKDQSLQIKLDHIQTASGKTITLSNEIFMNHIESIIDTFDTRSLEQYHIVDSSLNLTHLHLYFEQTSWTIMVYMIGSDLESSYNFYDNDLYGHASTDLEEMMRGHTSDNIHVVIETGGTKNWRLDNISPGINQRWKINKENMELLQTLERKNMSDQETLYDFTTWAIDSYPSDNYALILWNHGGGSLYGFGLDEYFPKDSLTLDEIDNVLERVTHEQTMLFEVIGFDACLMATLETAAILEPYANYLIASEETEPDSGWDYERILTHLGDGEAYNGKSFGELVVSGFFDASIDQNQDGLLTLSVIDLKFIPTVIQRMNRLFDSVIETNQFNLLSKTIPQVKAFGGNTQLTGYTDHYDIENFAERTLEFLPSESNRLLAAIDDAVIYKANGYLTTDAGGLSFYLPFYDLEKNRNLADLYSLVSFSESYFSFVNQFITYRLSNTVSSTMIPYTLHKETRPYQIQIADGFEHLVSDIYLGVSVFETRNDGEYRLNLGYDAWIYESFESGLYEESFGYWPTIGDIYLPISVVYNGNDYIEYETPVLLNNEPIMLISAWLYDEERYIIFGGRPIITDEGLTDRNTIEFEDGDQIDILYSYYNKSTDQWTEEIATSLTYDRASELIITNKPLKENSEYGISFIIKDLNGTLSYTDMIRFIHE